MLLYAITQRSLFVGDENARRNQLIHWTRMLARSGVPYIQIREKDLPPDQLNSLAAAIVKAARSESNQIKILLNGPAAVAVEAGCHGIHLPGDTPAEQAQIAQSLFARAGRICTISAACHTHEEIRNRRTFADILLFAPVFEKITPGCIIPGAGLTALSQAVVEAQGTPLLALGGVTAINAPACKAAGAQGIAAIRLFLDQHWKPLLDQ
jgi:thiamine-phosphate pyrophosphorylase